MAQIIDGKKYADHMAGQLASDVKALPFVPTLAVILVGEDYASQRYVGAKVRRAEEIGIRSRKHELKDTAPEDVLLDLIAELNDDDDVDGILVQLPLPAHMNTNRVINAISREKDVDGIGIINMGKLMVGANGLRPCTPLGCLHLIKSVQTDLAGLHAVVIGRSTTVGKPMAQLLLAENCTVTVVHSKTPQPAQITRQADIVVAATGQAGLVKADWIKPGAIVIDVGINRGAENKLTGDVDFAAVSPVAGAITPVPGGVGPMTVICLMENTLKAARKRRESAPLRSGSGGGASRPSRF